MDRILPPTYVKLAAGDPQHVAKYRFLGRLGAGGMGIAYLAEADGRWVVVKVLRADLASNGDFRTRLRRELDSLRRLDGTGAVRVLDSDLECAAPWFAMEFIEGQNLADRVEAVGPLSGMTLAAFADDLADQIAAIHKVGITHRDIKPRNIILSPKGVHVIDFGVALVDERTAMTTTGVMVGTLGWAAPEQVAGDPVGSAVDVHAWGLCVLYAATGRSPFAAESAAGLLYKVVHTKPEIPPGLPAGLSARVAAALHKSQADRPSMPDLRREGTDFSPTAVDPAEVPTEVWTDSDTTQESLEQQAYPNQRGIHPVLIAIVAALIVVVGLSVAASVYFRSGSNTDASQIGAGDSGGSPAGSSDSPLRYAVEAAVPAGSIQVGETVVLTVTIGPPSMGVPLRAFLDQGTEPQTLGTAVTDSRGAAQITFEAPAEAGPYVVGIEADDPSGTDVGTTFVDIAVLRAPTIAVDAVWPSRPQRWCSSIDIPVRVSPAQAGRTVALESRDNTGGWDSVSSTTTLADGTALLGIPDCSADSEGSPTSLELRVTARETSSMEARSSPVSRVPYCPAPQSLPYTLDAFAEFAPLEVVITNPYSDCAAYARIEAEFTCLADAFGGEIPPLDIGRRVSDPPLYVGPGETRSLEFIEVFTDSQERCRNYFPGYVIWPSESTLKVYVDYFEAP